jgi:RNA polymerase primary sigma factor
VIAIAHKYQTRDMPLDDCIQEGNIGLMRAAEKYDGKKDTRFSTYASWWIKQSILLARYKQGNNILSRAKPVPYIEHWKRVPATDTQIVQATGYLHHDVRETRGSQP